jgi:hypothetical protein
MFMLIAGYGASLSAALLYGAGMIAGPALAARAVGRSILRHALAYVGICVVLAVIAAYLG